MDDARLLRARLAAPLLTATGLALIAAQAVLPVTPADVGGQVDAIAMHRSAEVASAAAFVAAAGLLASGLLTVNARDHVRGRGMTRAGLVISILGTFWAHRRSGCLQPVRGSDHQLTESWRRRLGDAEHHRQRRIHGALADTPCLCRRPRGSRAWPVAGRRRVLVASSGLVGGRTRRKLSRRPPSAWDQR